mgnify:CR=1 FL=1
MGFNNDISQEIVMGIGALIVLTAFLIQMITVIKHKTQPATPSHRPPSLSLYTVVIYIVAEVFYIWAAIMLILDGESGISLLISNILYMIIFIVILFFILRKSPKPIISDTTENMLITGNKEGTVK